MAPHVPELWPNIKLGTIQYSAYAAFRFQWNRTPETSWANPASHTKGKDICPPGLRLGASYRAQSVKQRYTTDRITAHKTRRDKNFTKLAKNMWKKLLERNGTLPENWLQNREVLVDISSDLLLANRHTT